MQDYSEDWRVHLVRIISSRVYLAGLTLYPESFRRRFGSEMGEIFLEAFDDRRQQGRRAVVSFLFHELAEAPGSIFNQHLEARSFWLKPYPLNITSFILAFVLMGFIEVSGFFQGSISWWIGLLFIGGISGLAIGCTLAPARIKLITLGGAIGFLLANTLVRQLYFRIFPNAFQDIPASGLQFLISFIYPILVGSVFGLFIGIANGKWRGLLHLTGLGGFGFLAGFFVNRLSAALMQSYLIHSSTQNIALSDIHGVIAYIVVPYVLEGILLGTLFGGSAQRLRSLQA